MLTVAADLGSFLTLERNEKLTCSGILVNLTLVLSCLFALLYPMFEILGLMSMDCPFHSLTGLPCPGCGYTRSIESLMAGELFASFLHNPGWIVLVFFLGTMITLGIRSLIHRKQFVLNRRWMVMFIVLLAGAWVGKFILGSAYY